MAFNLFPQIDFRQMDLNYVLEVSKQAAANLEEYAADKEQVVATQAAAEQALAAAQEDIQTATNAAARAEQNAQTATGAAGTATQAAASASADAETASEAAQTAQEVAESIPADYSQLSQDVDDLKIDLNTVEDTLFSYSDSFFSFTIGGINGVSGQSNNLTNHLRTFFKILNVGDIVCNVIPDTYSLHLYRYLDGEYIGRTLVDTNEYVITESGSYRIMVNKLDEHVSDAFTDAERVQASSQIYVKLRHSLLDDKADISVVNNKVPYPVTNKYGNVNEVLTSNGDGTTVWKPPVNIEPPVVEDAVDSWLNNHPEATTTVLDWSLSYSKLIKGTLGFVTPLMFGAIGDGVTDDSIAIQAAIDYCVNNNIGIVDGADKTYVVSDTVSGDATVVGNNKGVCVYGNIIFQNFNLLLKNNVQSDLTSVLNAYNNHNERLIIRNVNIDGNMTNQTSHTGAQDGGFHGIRIAFEIDCGFIEISKCIIRNCYTDGICTRPVNYDDLTIKYCYISGNGRNGITDNALNSYLENCVIVENGTRHNPKSGYHIEPDNSKNYGTKKIFNCNITDNVSGDVRVYFNTKTYNMNLFEINSCNIGKFSWGNHGITDDCLHKNIKILNSSLISIVYGNGDSVSALNKFEFFEISNSFIADSIVIDGGKDYQSEGLILSSVYLSGKLDVYNTKNIKINNCQLKSDNYSLAVGSNVDNAIITSNSIENSGNGTSINLGSCDNVIFCNNISDKNENATISDLSVTNIVKANNIFAS